MLLYVHKVSAGRPRTGCPATSTVMHIHSSARGNFKSHMWSCNEELHSLYRSPNIVRVRLKDDEYLGPRGMRMERRFHNEEFHSLYRSPNIVRVRLKDGEYLGPIGMRLRNGEGSTMRNIIVCTVQLI